MLSEVAEKCDACELWGSSCLQQSTGKPNNLDLEIALSVQKNNGHSMCLHVSCTVFFNLAFFTLLELVEGGDTCEFCAVLVVTIDWKKPYHP
jgi:hypothetical protein